jgi:hypothetical protein
MTNLKECCSVKTRHCSHDMIQMSEEANGFEDRKEMKKKGRKEEYSAE